MEEKLDYIIHLASNTHPKSYANQPISTITTNVLGTINLLELAKNNPGSRVLLLSSVEIYGENKSNEKESFSEKDFGYIDCNTVRAGYNESKRCSETLACAYNSECGVDFVIARLCRCYGPTLLKTDTKALSQFIFHALKSENIVLKSEGLQNYSYIYASDQAYLLGDGTFTKVAGYMSFIDKHTAFAKKKLKLLNFFIKNVLYT